MAGASVMSQGVAEGMLAALMKSDGAPAGGHDPFTVREWPQQSSQGTRRLMSHEVAQTAS